MMKAMQSTELHEGCSEVLIFRHALRMPSSWLYRATFIGDHGTILVIFILCQCFSYGHAFFTPGPIPIFMAVLWQICACGV